MLTPFVPFQLAARGLRIVRGWREPRASWYLRAKLGELFPQMARSSLIGETLPRILFA